MSQNLNFGKPLKGAPRSFEYSLHKLAEFGTASAFRCYFPEELTFEALVRAKHSGWREDAPTCRVRVLGFRASYITLTKSGHSLSFEPRYAIVKKTGRSAKNLYLAAFGPYASRASVDLVTEQERLARVIETSPFQEHIENKQSALADVLASHYKGDISKAPISLDAEFSRNKFMEDAFRAVRLQRMEARERAQQKVLEAASIHFTHFHGDLNTKFNGLMGGLDPLRRNATANTKIQASEEAAHRHREEALKEMVTEWGNRLEAKLRGLAKAY